MEQMASKVANTALHLLGCWAGKPAYAVVDCERGGPGGLAFVQIARK